jgi:hypothetical protein
MKELNEKINKIFFEELHKSQMKTIDDNNVMKLIILDFDKQITYIYRISDNQFDNKEYHNGSPAFIDGSIDDLIDSLGHRANNCQWMITKNEVINK